ncbi:EpsG family protein [Parabacteroides sp.]|uniref:EpsG family protein n=1 Tax=Parabacteroides sp. TaxID=1869337 RepID=UPI00257CFC76|nr:EpsG family protein [Parabacteroides sp.]
MMRKQGVRSLSYSAAIGGCILVLLVVALLNYFLFSPSRRVTAFFYLGMIVCSVFFSSFAQLKPNNRIKKIPLVCSFVFLYFVLAFRDVSGVDDPTYQRLFENVNAYGWRTAFLTSFVEPGYLFMCQLIGYFTDNYYVFQAIASFLPLFFIYKGFVKYSHLIYVPLSLLLFCCTLYFQMLSVSLVRMFIAIGIVFCYTLDALFRGDTRKFVCSILCASMIHYSSLIMLLFFPLTLSPDYVINHWKKTTFVLIFFLFLLFVMAGKVAGMVGGRYAIYEEGEGGFSIASFDTFPFLLMTLFGWRSIPHTMWNMYVCSIILLVFSSVCTVMSAIVPLGRVIFYMNLSLWILLPAMFKFCKYRLVVATVIVVYSFLYLFVTQFSQELRGEHLFPYINIFFTL